VQPLRCTDEGHLAASRCTDSCGFPFRLECPLKDRRMTRPAKQVQPASYTPESHALQREGSASSCTCMGSSCGLRVLRICHAMPCHAGCHTRKWRVRLHIGGPPGAARLRWPSDDFMWPAMCILSIHGDVSREDRLTGLSNGQMVKIGVCLVCVYVVSQPA